MDLATKQKIQKYEKSRILALMAEIEETTKMMFHHAFPELWDMWEKDIADHTETRATISRYRCKLQNTLKALKA